MSRTRKGIFDVIQPPTKQCRNSLYHIPNSLPSDPYFNPFWEMKVITWLVSPSFLSSSDFDRVPMLNQSLPLNNFCPLVLDLSSRAPKNVYSLSHITTLYILEGSSSALLSQAEVRKTFLPCTHIQHAQAQ